MTMSVGDAVTTAIEALEYQAEEIYEDSEYDEPDVQAYVTKQNEAITVLANIL